MTGILQTCGAWRLALCFVTVAVVPLAQADDTHIEVKSFDPMLLESMIFQETNRVRAEHSRPGLTSDADASKAARGHSLWMVHAQVLSHGQPENGGKSKSDPMTRLHDVGLRPMVVAENVAFNFRLNYESGRKVYLEKKGARWVFSYESGGAPLRGRTYAEFAVAVVAQLMDSPTHRANLLSAEVTHIGTGVAMLAREGGMDRIFVTQDFFTPAPIDAWRGR